MIIYIGLHKTGSTFLQKKIFPNFENYKFISRPFTQRNSEFNALQYSDESTFNEKLTFQKLRKFSGNYIISDEAFSGLIYHNYINRTTIAR